VTSATSPPGSPPTGETASRWSPAGTGSWSAGPAPNSPRCWCCGPMPAICSRHPALATPSTSTTSSVTTTKYTATSTRPASVSRLGRGHHPHACRRTDQAGAGRVLPATAGRHRSHAQQDRAAPHGHGDNQLNVGRPIPGACARECRPQTAQAWLPALGCLGLASYPHTPGGPATPHVRALISEEPGKGRRPPERRAGERS
jgi:hypothetical protein